MQFKKKKNSTAASVSSKNELTRHVILSTFKMLTDGDGWRSV